MTDLTEQWKKGKLPSGEYYIIDDLGLHTTDKYYPSHGFGTELPQSVLGRVPTYEECKAKLEENAQLKELLEECSPYIGHSAASRTIKNSVGHKKDMKLLTKIDEALK